MSDTIAALAPGDIIEIQYRLWRAAPGAREAMVERWISAHVIHCERGTWPLARLADGQTTEVRPFMTWRSVYRTPRPALAA
jgi:hypothetical protein